MKHLIITLTTAYLQTQSTCARPSLVAEELEAAKKEDTLFSSPSLSHNCHVRTGYVGCAYQAMIVREDIWVVQLTSTPNDGDDVSEFTEEEDERRCE